MNFLKKLFGKSVDELKRENEQSHKELEIIQRRNSMLSLSLENKESLIEVLENQLKNYERYKVEEEINPFSLKAHYYIKTKKTLPDTLNLLKRQNLYIKLLENTLEENEVRKAKITFNNLLEVKCNENKPSS